MHLTGWLEQGETVRAADARPRLTPSPRTELHGFRTRAFPPGPDSFGNSGSSTADDTQSLEALNRKLWAWIEGEYHHAPHRGLSGQTPLDRWALSADEVRYVPPTLDLDDLMLWEEKRRVQKDRTVSLHGTVYEVDAALIASTVVLRFDPSSAKRSVQVWKDGKRLEDAKRVDLYANCFVRRERPSRTLVASEPASAPRQAGLRLSELRNRKDPE